MPPILNVQQIAMRFGPTEVFRGVTFSVEPGDRFALLGPSGCGKSTLLRLIAGLETPTAGTIVIGGREASRGSQVLLAPHERLLSMVFQDLALWPNLTARKNVELGLAGQRLSRASRHKRATAALAACGIAALADRRPDELSGGQQQRVALARALAVQPKMLLLDEPFASLDISTKSRLYSVVDQLCTELGLTLIVVTHDPLEATALCSRAAVLEEGCIAEVGALDVLLRAPVSATLNAFVAQLDMLGARPTPGEALPRNSTRRT
jgi:ABC-type Fe3+/spermidine/putrescine transport system ATPase subunit